jgi:8-oxo-dGTP diphosphatase
MKTSDGDVTVSAPLAEPVAAAPGALERGDHLVAWLVLRRDDGHVLLARRANESYASGLWGLPGGHVEDDETLAAAAARELSEEVGVHVDVTTLEPLGVTRYVEGDARGCDFYFLARTWLGEPVPTAECDEVQWCDPADLPDDALPWLPASLRRHLIDRVWWDDLPAT